MREFAGLFADFKSRQQYILKLKKHSPMCPNSLKSLCIKAIFRGYV